MKNMVLVTLSALLFCFGCTKKEQAKPIDYYVSHIDEARQVLKDCQARIKTASDMKAVMSEENCANASIAQDRWLVLYTTNAGKSVPVHHTFFNQKK